MKSNMLYSPHKGMIINHARFSRISFGTGYLAFKNQIITI
jgi:hypothetical protein